MKIKLKPLYSKLNSGVRGCPVGCQSTCKVKPYLTCDVKCPLSTHQVETYQQITQSDADIIFNTSATGDGKSLAAYLPGLLDSQFRTMGLYPTIELVEDQTKQQQEYHIHFDRNPSYRIDRLYGIELSRRVKEQDSDRHEKENTRQELANSDRPVLVVRTSAVDVGVDFKIHLLICEGSDSATVIQRLGRLGRHAGFNSYQAYVLIANRTPWIMSLLEEEIKESIITREQLTKAIEIAFNPPQQFT